MHEVIGYPYQTERSVSKTCDLCHQNLTEVTASRYEHMHKEGFYRVFLYCKNCVRVVAELPS